LANGATPIASIGAAVEQLVATVRSPSQLVLPLATPAATTRSEAPTEDEPATPELDEDAEVVLGALKSGALGSDALCARTGLGFPRVSRALLTLSLRGLALQISTGAYCLAPGGPSGSPP
jgi:predicted Rossmann fold nucleotide-binding protein DprA/Smf involved in DNA uptake